MSRPSAIWVDMQLPPRLCAWITDRTGISCEHFSNLDMERTDDAEAFRRARDADVLIISKDVDFARFVQELGPPPSVLWLRFGNSTTDDLLRMLESLIGDALVLIESGESLVTLVSPPT